MKVRLVVAGAAMCAGVAVLCPTAFAAPVRTGGGPAGGAVIPVDPGAAAAPIAAAAAPIEDAAAAAPALAAPAFFPPAGGALPGPVPAVLPAGAGAGALPGPVGAGGVGDPALVVPAAPIMPGK